MQRQCLSWKEAMPVLAVLVLLATRPGPFPSARPLAPKPLPENIVTAWKEAGAEVGWMRVTRLASAFVRRKKPSPATCRRFASPPGKRYVWRSCLPRRRPSG